MKQRRNLRTLEVGDPSLGCFLSIFFQQLSLLHCSFSYTFLQGFGLLWVYTTPSKAPASDFILIINPIGNIIIWINAHTPKPIKNTWFSQMDDCSLRFHLLYYRPIHSWLKTCSWPYYACGAHSDFSFPTALLLDLIHNSLAVSWHFFISGYYCFHKLCMQPSALVAFTNPQKCWIRIPALLPASDIIYSFFSYTNRV